MRSIFIAFVLLFVSLSATAEESGFPSWYYKVGDHQLKKEHFMKILLPVIEEENRQTMQERAFVEAFFADDFFVRLDKKLQQNNMTKLSKLAHKYNIQNLFSKEEYLKKIDAIPNSMALAQAALESGWGRSLYARQLNNIYGHYSFTQTVPSKKVAGKRERIRIFKSIQDSVASYMHNLNSHWAYKEFREERYAKRQEGEDFTGNDGIQHIRRYSILGQRYINKLHTLMRVNHLMIYDRPYESHVDLQSHMALN